MADQITTIQTVPFECQLTQPLATVPSRIRHTDAGCDLVSVEPCDVTPGTIHKIPTGLRIAPPEGWYYTIHGRSSLFAKGLIVCNSIIDAGYTGLIYIMMYNITQTCVNLPAGSKIAQLLPHRIEHVTFSVVDEFSDTHNARGEAGWGSTGLTKS